MPSYLIKIILYPLAIGIMTPSLVIFTLQVFIGNYTVIDSVKEIASNQFAEGHNLFLLALMGLIPFVILIIITSIYHYKKNREDAYCLMLFGLVGILFLMIPAHWSVWYPLYGPGKMSSTAVVAFLFIPFYSLVAMAVGLLLGTLFNSVRKKNTT